MTSRYKYTNSLIIGTMILAFWLVILFLDGAFSAKPTVLTNDTLSAAPTVSGQVFGEIEQSSVVAADPVTEMVSGVVHQGVGNSEIFQDLSVLEYLYTTTKNPDLLPSLTQRFLQYYQFDKANAYLSLLVSHEGDYFKLNLDPRQVLYVRFNAPDIGLDTANAFDDIFSLSDAYRAHGMLTQDDELFYKGLKALRGYDYDTATAAFSKITDSRYQDFKNAYESALANYAKIKNPPAYYRDGLVALTLLKNGYFVFAKRLALHALFQDEQYILPYQVLAYTDFLMHNREAAKEYFLKLADFDQANASAYKFLIGICYYRYGDYEQSLLYLNQVKDPKFQTDVSRYMLLGYIQMGDTDNMIRMRQTLLGQDGLQPSDFALFFDQIFTIPFRSGKPFTLFADNPQLVDMYIGKCSTLFSGVQADVCTYGQVGLQLAKQNLSSMGQALISLTQSYHQSYLYHLLGDYYLALQNYPAAKDAYVKALSICDDTNEQTILKSKIDQVNAK